MTIFKPLRSLNKKNPKIKKDSRINSDSNFLILYSILFQYLNFLGFSLLSVARSGSFWNRRLSHSSSLAIEDYSQSLIEKQQSSIPKMPKRKTSEIVAHRRVWSYLGIFDSQQSKIPKEDSKRRRNSRSTEAPRSALASYSSVTYSVPWSHSRVLFVLESKIPKFKDCSSLAVRLAESKKNFEDSRIGFAEAKENVFASIRCFGFAESATEPPKRAKNFGDSKIAEAPKERRAEAPVRRQLDQVAKAKKSKSSAKEKQKNIQKTRRSLNNYLAHFLLLCFLGYFGIFEVWNRRFQKEPEEAKKKKHRV
uniref:Uncharacterized protein n=1 Tax=Pediastrum angulosum TaxID=271408 RepID=A0A2U8GHF2_9CHLO|nr:hypothetical protein [Pediastrum angulosum]AWI68127.1 hypothetical protein [Pediastrum angulosum]